MSCPDTERVVDLALRQALDPAAAAHLRECSDCREEVRLIEAIREAHDPVMSVPDELIEAAVELVIAETSRPTAALAPGRWDVAAAGALGSLTVLLTVVATGSAQGGPSWMIGFSVLGGLAAASYEATLHRDRL